MRKIANFTVEDEPVAHGGMGQILRGRDEQGHVVAIKEILPQFATDLSILTRIEKEVQFLLKCDHPSIVKLYLAFFDEATQNYYIVMEMVEGENIEQYVMRHGPFSEQETVELTLKILDALQCVHNAHIIHRDIKPSNIMIRPNGNICLLDFGVAKDMDNGGGTIAGSIIGTDGYMSPEQANGFTVKYNTDIYSLGCVMYYMLTGHHAYNVLKSEFETKDAIINGEFPRISKYRKDVSEAMQQILDHATDKNMTLRYQNCYEFMGALNNGTHISRTGSSALSIKLSLGREKCDIIFNDPQRKISRHHADVELKVMTGGKYYIFTDCSANGTWINGRKIHQQSVNIPAAGAAPDIRLANVAEGHVDWQEVTRELSKRVQAMQDEEDIPSSTTNEMTEKTEEKPVPPVQAERYVPEKATGLLIAAYVFSFPLGLIFGLYVFLCTTTDAQGNKVKKYNDSHRLLGLFAAILFGIVIIVAIAALCIYNYYYYW